MSKINLKFLKTVQVEKGPKFEVDKVYEFGLDKEFYTHESAQRWLKRKVAVVTSESSKEQSFPKVEITEGEVFEESSEAIVEGKVDLGGVKKAPTTKRPNVEPKAAKTKVDKKATKAENVL